MCLFPPWQSQHVASGHSTFSFHSQYAKTTLAYQSNLGPIQILFLIYSKYSPNFDHHKILGMWNLGTCGLQEDITYFNMWSPLLIGSKRS
jgi:hypothetical protein